MVVRQVYSQLAHSQSPVFAVEKEALAPLASLAIALRGTHVKEMLALPRLQTCAPHRTASVELACSAPTVSAEVSTLHAQ